MRIILPAFLLLGNLRRHTAFQQLLFPRRRKEPGFLVLPLKAGARLFRENLRYPMREMIDGYTFYFEIRVQDLHFAKSSSGRRESTLFSLVQI